MINELCLKCNHSCKQKLELVECARYESKPRTAPSGPVKPKIKGNVQEEK